jgi:branched-chain amino acid transport system substrate-binding protein
VAGLSDVSGLAGCEEEVAMDPSQRRARPFAAVALVALATAVAACGSSGDGGSAAKADGPVKIGVLLPYTGPFGLYGKPMEAALRARLKAAGDRAGGRQVQLIFEDEATDPKVAVAKATKLLDQQHVDAIVCCATGAATLAVGPILAERKVPQLGPIPNPSGLSRYPTAAVAAPTAGHDAEALGRYAASKLGYRTATVVASDFAYGKEVADAFAKGFTSEGGQVTGTVFAPLGTQDFGSYLAKVGHPDVVFGGFAGADAIGFVKQYRKFGVKAPLIGHGPLVTELVLNAIGPDAVGVGAGFYYSSQLDNPENERFVAAMKAIPKLVPSHFTAGAWATGSVLLDAVKRAGADVGDGEAFAQAIRATDIPAPWGELKFDPKTGYAVAPTYYYDVTDSGGTLRHHIDREIPAS